MAVGLVALAALLFEVTLTRIFAVTLWYHFGFLAISLALMGTAAAGVLVYLYSDRLAGRQYAKYMSMAALGFAMCVPIAVIVHIGVALPSYAHETAFYLIFGTQLLLLFAAFFFAGLSITIGLLRYSNSIGTVYFSDLLGASIGSLLVVPLLYQISAPSLTLVISAIAAVASCLLSGVSRSKRLGMPSAVAAVVFVWVAVGDPPGLLEIRAIKSYEEGLQQREVGRVFEKWSPVSRVAVFAPRVINGHETMRVTNDAGAPTTLHRFDGDYSDATFLRRDSRQIVHALKENADILVIGSGGGMDVLAALAANQRKITAVEINPVLGDLVTGRYADYVGRIFQDPRVTLHIQEGRNFAAASRQRYDIIQITMVDSWGGAAAGAYVFNENSLYTVEAVRDYMGHLKPGGVLSITRYYNWDEALRLTNTFIAALEGNGIENVEDKLILVLEGSRERYRRVTVLLKNGTFTAAEAYKAAKIAEERGSTLIHAPYLPPDKLEQDQRAGVFRALIQPENHGTTRNEIVQSYPSNISPTTDDRPFFFFTKRLGDVFHSSPDEHPARRLALPLLYTMLGVFGLISLLMIWLPLTLRSGALIREAPYGTRLLVYFSMLGIGFMLIELSLIQRLTVFLGHPIWSFVVVLTTLLFSCGLGSGFSERLRGTRVLVLVLSFIVLLMVAYIFLIYDQFTHLMWLPKPARIGVAILATAPPGFVMGMCLPMGMRLAKQVHAALVPWGWGVNGAFSVFASILSIVLALNLGFKATIAMGALSYAIALSIILSLRDSGRFSTRGIGGLPTARRDKVGQASHILPRPAVVLTGTGQSTNFSVAPGSRGSKLPTPSGPEGSSGT